jgi:drug/metabolite transporter (DMT)-like permease
LFLTGSPPDTLILLLVLLAAVLHASWNALVKSGDDKLVMQTLVIAPGLLLGLAIPFLPPLAPEAWPYVIASLVLHLAYFGFLVRCYQHGDLSQVYPIARGSAPALVALGGWALAGETQSLGEWLGLACVSLGILSLAWRRGLPHDGQGRAVAYALITGLLIASYSLADGLGGRASGHVWTYIAWSFCLESAIFLGFTLWVRRGRWRTSFGPYLAKGLFGGVLAMIAYAIVIWAMSVTAMAHVVALRETSVLIAAAIGTLLLREPFGQRRIAAAGVVAAGAILLQVGG